MTRALRTIAVTLTLAAATAAAAFAQGVGTVTGAVTDQATQQPLPGVQVGIAGTNLSAITNQQGSFLLLNVPAGEHTVRVQVLGYAVENRPVTVRTGETTRVDIGMRVAAIELDELIVSAVTGRAERRRELGNVVGAINMDRDVSLATVQSFSQVLQARSPGVTVLQSSGTVGAGSRVRIRGSNSVSLSNSPLLVIDGVRVHDSPQSFQLFTGGQTVSRLDDLNPEDIESIEILKGPAASALYGTAAANGVIQVTTRRGRPGQTVVRAYTEASTANLGRYEWPLNYFGVAPAGSGVGALRRCAVVDRSLPPASTAPAPACVAPEVIHTGTPLRDPVQTPFRTGSGARYGFSLAGGSEAATYYVSTDIENETGVQVGNDIESFTLRANLTGRVRENLNIGVNAGYTNRQVQLPQNDNSALSPFLNALRGNPHPIYTDTASATFSGGYRPPLNRAMGLAWEQYQDNQRFIGSSNATWRPQAWLTVNATGGLDVLSRFDNGIVNPGILTPFGSPFAEGLREQWRYTFFNYSGVGSATAVFELNDDIRSTSSAGVQYVEERSNLTAASGSGLSPGSRTTTTPRTAAEGYAENRTFGAFGQQQFAWQDRVFVTGALRGDQNSAFGENLAFVWYPSLSGSWVISEEPFFPDLPLLDNLRFRAAWGRSGLRPGLNDAQQTFAVASAAVRNQVIPGFIIDLAGNPDLRPEIATEFETGFDLTLFQNRLGFQATYYNKRSQDALVNRPLTPSFGSSPSRMENLGEVLNRGFELLVEAEPIRMRDFGMNLSLSYANTRNELVTLGEDIPPILLGVQRHREGYPLGGFWLRPFTFNDANNDGLISFNEVQLGDTAVYMGTPFPTRELTLNANVRVMDMVRVSAMVDHRGGHQQFNWTEYSRCVASLACEAAVDPSVPLERQAAILAATAAMGGDLGASGFLEDATFTKLREVAITLLPPATLTRRVGLAPQGLSLTLAGRNLATWTSYTGFDPEVNSTGQTNFLTDDYFTLPPARRYTLRVDVSF
jgi:TonB-dependent starch-binding outer membrane protein SusC